jgi:hypothetical protein
LTARYPEQNVAAVQAAQLRVWWEAARGGGENLTRADLLDIALGLPPPRMSKAQWVARHCNGAVEALSGFLKEAEAAGDRAEADDIRKWIAYAKVNTRVGRPFRCLAPSRRGDLAARHLFSTPKNCRKICAIAAATLSACTGWSLVLPSPNIG